MSGLLEIRNRQRARRLDTALLRRIAIHLLRTYFPKRSFELCLHLVAAKEMAQLNQTFLQHEGSTDVITFDHAGDASGPNTGVATDRPLHGEIYICVEDAVIQSKAFATSWMSEVVRYAVHGVLHLAGHDDVEPAARRRMKRVENRLVTQLGGAFSFHELAPATQAHTSVLQRRAARRRHPKRPPAGARRAKAGPPRRRARRKPAHS